MTRDLFFFRPQGSYDFFIGLSDLGHEGRYRWLWSGAEAKYFAWGGVDPDGGLGQACALMFGQIPLYDYAWADIGCTDYNAYPLCEMDGYIP